MEGRVIKPVAVMRTDFPAKFGIPRQSGLVAELCGKIVFTPEYRQAEALRGIEEFSHLWILWDFSEARQERFVPTVFPPRLGGRKKRGVFATRAPFLPNSIGLSCVKLDEVRTDGEEGPALYVSGVDLLDGTPIYDIKPYLPYADAHPEARGGFGQAHSGDAVEVIFPEELLCRLPEEKRKAALGVLAQDPRAAYNKRPDYVYGMEFAGYDIRFTAADGKLTVCGVVDKSRENWEKVK